LRHRPVIRSRLRAVWRPFGLRTKTPRRSAPLGKHRKSSGVQLPPGEHLWVLGGFARRAKRCRAVGPESCRTIPKNVPAVCGPLASDLVLGVHQPDRGTLIVPRGVSASHSGTACEPRSQRLGRHPHDMHELLKPPRPHFRLIVNESRSARAQPERTLVIHGLSALPVRLGRRHSYSARHSAGSCCTGVGPGHWRP
jgi:hypothetical protein